MVHYYLQMQKYAFLRIKSRFTIICLIKYSYYNNGKHCFCTCSFSIRSKADSFWCFAVKKQQIKKNKSF